jgi:adenylyltransferase/sulfurtransferase
MEISKLARGTTLSADELVRYSRQLILPQVGVEGQQKLRSCSALVVGAGGLGSPVLLYLAAAGIGRLGIVDHENVELSNLHRQILHSTSSVNQPKVESARYAIGNANPHVDVTPLRIKLTSANALEILQQYDIIVDGSDNFPTRYLLSDAGVISRKPVIYGSIFRFEGQVSVFDGMKGPCYRCLFPEPPAPTLVPNCAEGGVLGPLAGIIGSIQASEAIKVLLGIGEPLIGRLLAVDALRTEFTLLSLKKNPDCPVCGPSPSIRTLIDYEEFCGTHRDSRENILEITPRQLDAWLKGGGEVVILDVREPYEYEIANIGGRLIPLSELPRKYKLLDPYSEIVAVCHHGNRSGFAVEFLLERGFRKVKNLVGGIERWSTEVDPSVPRY